MDQAWIAEEKRLWEAMHACPPTSGSKKNAAIIQKARRAGKVPPKFPTEAEVVSQSWRIYSKWVSH